MVGLAFGLRFAAQKAWANILDVDSKVLWDAQDLLLCELIAYLLMELFQVVAVAD